MVVVNFNIVHKFTFKREDWKHLVVTIGGLSWTIHELRTSIIAIPPLADVAVSNQVEAH